MKRSANNVSGPAKMARYLPPLVEQIIQDEAYGFQEAAEDVYRILVQRYTRRKLKERDLFGKWNRFFRLLESAKTLPDDDMYLAKIAEFSFTTSAKLPVTSSAKTKDIMDLCRIAAAAMEKFMAQKFVGMDFVAEVLAGMVRERPVDLENRVLRILERVAVPKLVRDFPEWARVRPGIVDVFATNHQKSTYTQQTVHALGTALGVLDISKARQSGVFKAVCTRIPSLFAWYVVESAQSTENECRAIRMYRRVCTKVTTRILDMYLWPLTLILGDVDLLRCFLAGSSISVRRKVHNRYPLNIAANSVGESAPERVSLIRRRIPAEMGLAWRNRARLRR